MADVIALTGAENTLVDFGVVTDRRSSAEMLGDVGSPLTIDGPVFENATIVEAAKSGVQTLLTGVDGDATVLHGFPYLTELWLSLRWGDLIREVSSMSRNIDMSGVQVVRARTVGAMLPPAVHHLYRQLSGREHRAQSHSLRPGCVVDWA